MTRLLPLLAATAALLLGALAVRAGDEAPTNMIEALQQRLDSGAMTLAYADDGHGYLQALLKTFDIPRTSQVLVFSGGSLQFDRISQKTPRALYYRDDISVGTVQDGRFIEIIVSDRDTDLAYYTLDAARGQRPQFTRRTGECIICHGFASRWASGLMVSNTETGPGGKILNLDPRNLFYLTTQATPFAERYGGWYVTGNTGAMKHRGNVTLNPADSPTLPPGGLNLASLAGRIDPARYLEPGSDIVSLLTLEHQAGVINLIARINAQYRGLDNDDIKPALRATAQDIDASIAQLVTVMRFADEVALPSPVQGSSGFAASFAAEGPHDGKGRSLREFELRSRLFRHPLSYMIYSQAFADLNPQARMRVLRGLYDALGKARGGAAAINIAAATVKMLPDFWQPVAE